MAKVAKTVAPKSPDDASPVKRQSRSLATRQKLLDGARKSFEERGYHGSRISDITENAGVALGNFYRHFENKNEIFAEVLRPIFEAWHASSGRSVHEKPARTIEELAERNARYISVFVDHKMLFRAGYEAASSIQSDHFFGTWFDLREMFFARSRAWLAGVKHDGLAREDINIDLMAEALGAMNEQFIYIRVIRNENKLEDDEINMMARMLAEIWWRTLFNEQATQNKKLQ